MSKSSFKRNMAVASGSALLLSGLAAVPAHAVLYPADYMEWTPDSGDYASVFTLDTLEMDLDLSQLIPQDNQNLLAIKITSEDDPLLEVKFDDAVIGQAADEITLQGMKDGVAVAIDADGAGNANFDIVVDADAGGAPFVDGDRQGSFVIDFEALKIDTLVIHTIDSSFIDEDLNFSFRVLDNVADQDDSDFTHTKTERDAETVSPYGDGSFAIGVQAYLETNADPTDVDDNAGEVVTMNFWDQEDVSAIVTVDRFESGNTEYGLLLNATAIPFSVKWSREINNDQISLTHWQFGIDSSVGANDATDKAGAVTKRTLDGLPDLDANGALTATVTTNAAAAAETLSVNVTANNSAGAVIAGARQFRSPAATVLAAADDSTDGTTYAVTGDAADDEAGTVTAREGAATLTYTLSLEDGGVAQGANRPVFAVVSYTDSAEELDALVVSGHSRPILQSGEAIVTGFTNSDGEFALTVTSTNPEAGSDYVVEFHYIINTGATANATTAAITTTYATADYSAIDSDSDVYNGSDVTMSFTVENQFEEGIVETADGDEIKLRVEATNTDDLEEFLTVTDGAATLSFTNYLEANESDVITVTAYTGADTDPTDLSGSLSLTLYNTADPSVVTITNDDQTADVVYADFVTGDEGNVTDASKTTFAGTVLDGNGQGVPGAAVTISGAGIQFLNAAGDYTIGSASVVAGESGAWTIDAWTHLADDTELTVTSGTGSSTATFTGELDETGNMSAANLVFSWNLPSAVAVNTTYRVDATVTDVWGNPVPNATVTFAGEAAAQFNSDASVDKTTNAKGVATAYLRSLEDVTGLAAVSVTLKDDINFDGAGAADITDVGDTFTDDEDTSWDESAASDEITAEFSFASSVSAPAASADQKVNAGSFKGYVALYAKGYEGQRMSAKVGKDWVVVPALASNFVRVVEFTGAGVDVAVRIYIDRVLLETINLTTK